MDTTSTTPMTLHVWATSMRAGEEARRRGDRRIGTDHILLALWEDPSMDIVLGVDLHQARQSLDSLDSDALAAMGLRADVDVPALPMRAVPTKPRFRDVATKDRITMTPAAKKVLERAVKPNRRKTYVTTQQVLAQILALQPPDPAAVLLNALRVNSSEILHRLNPIATDGEDHNGTG